MVMWDFFFVWMRGASVLSSETRIPRKEGWWWNKGGVRHQRSCSSQKVSCDEGTTKAQIQDFDQTPKSDIWPWGRKLPIPPQCPVLGTFAKKGCEKKNRQRDLDLHGLLCVRCCDPRTQFPLLSLFQTAHIYWVPQTCLLTTLRPPLSVTSHCQNCRS